VSATALFCNIPPPPVQRRGKRGKIEAALPDLPASRITWQGITRRAPPGQERHTVDFSNDESIMANNESKEVVTPSGLRYLDMAVGEGDTAAAGQRVRVHYSGWLENGTRFDSSVERNDPFDFTLGAGMVIKGWDEGVAGMQVGGRRRLVIPPELGYGARGAGGVIPPDATLIFEVELLAVG